MKTKSFKVRCLCLTHLGVDGNLLESAEIDRCNIYKLQKIYKLIKDKST